jgi:hypothetical protein
MIDFDEAIRIAQENVAKLEAKALQKMKQALVVA